MYSAYAASNASSTAANNNPGNDVTSNNTTNEMTVVDVSPASQTFGSLSPALLTAVPYFAIFLVFYFILIKPQEKKRKEREKHVEALKKGQEIVTIGGMFGKVHNIENDIITIEISPNVFVRILRSAIAEVIDKTQQGDKVEKKS